MSVDAYDKIRSLIGDPPFLAKNEEEVKKPDVENTTTTVTTKNVVLSDGTYGTVFTSESSGNPSDLRVDESVSKLRQSICGGNITIGTIAVAALTKIYFSLAKSNNTHANRIKLGTLLTIAGLGKFAELKRGKRVDMFGDSLERLVQFSRILLDPNVAESLGQTILTSGREAFGKLIQGQKNTKLKNINVGINGSQSGSAVVSQADDLIQFRQLRAQAVQGGIEVDLMDADDISRAIGLNQAGNDASKLNHIHQLTGYSDPVYAEATLTVHDYDIILEILIINRTPNTLTNLTVELATMGDLRIVERPQSFTIGPLDERSLRANIKVSSTETGHIFGTIVYDNASNAQKTYVTINDIQLDIMDYIRPAECKHEDFRDMWEEFEWENKV